MLAEEGWVCGECKEWWEDEYSAEDCCRPPDPEQSWKCTGCFEIYEDELNAEMCCPPFDLDDC